MIIFISVYNDPVSCLVVNENQVISGTTSNRIGIHSNIDKQNQVIIYFILFYQKLAIQFNFRQHFPKVDYNQIILKAL